MENILHKKLFKDYYFSNKGTLYKAFEININTFHYSYDIYWGDPNIIFDEKALRENFPLAITIIPHRYSYPNPRIFLHEKLEIKRKNAFEAVVAHEIGHLWLHDVVGFNNPSTNNFMRERDSEIWADYFAFYFFVKYRNINCLNDYGKLLEEVGHLQMNIYNLNPEEHTESTFTNKVSNLSLLNDRMDHGTKDLNSFLTQMRSAIEITLNALGDIFSS